MKVSAEFPTVYSNLKESMSRGLKPMLVVSFNVRDKSRTYLRSKSKSSVSNGRCKSVACRASMPREQGFRLGSDD
jgi:hypothetical protein